MTFEEKLQLLRKQRGLSQEELASQLVVSRQAISKWELGKSLPDTENVIQLSKLFGVSTDYLLNDEIESNDDLSSVPQNKFHNTIEMIIGIICAGIGLLGNVTLVTLSTMIQVHVTKERILPDGSVEYYGGGDVLGYSFWGFIEEYRLKAILIVLVIFFIAGTSLIVKNCKKKPKNEKTK